ncbi:MAG: YggS family pyridoxal phosphate-dependent enzyme [Candidatus Limnocylindrales bacterium]
MSEPANGIDSFRAARAEVLERIAAACERVGRDPADVQLVAVSKTVPTDRLSDAVAAGLLILGENRVQEGMDKRPAVPGAAWHLIGPLQSNKARHALETFDVIQSVATVALGERLDRLAAEVRPGERIPILVQVNVDDDPAKAGLRPGDVGDVVDRLLTMARLDVRGLMTIGRFDASADQSRSTFGALRELAIRLRSGRPGRRGLGPELSMGMSDDFEIAVQEGATIVRVGRALFGPRPHSPTAFE